MRKENIGRSGLPVLALALAGLALAGCEGKQGPAGPPGSGIPSYTMVFKKGVSPDPGYTDSLSTYVSAGYPDDSYYTTETLVVGSGPSPGDRQRVLLRFGLGSLPHNATITGAYLSLHLSFKTLPSGTWTVGLHPMNCAWIELATWNTNNGSDPWGACKTSPDSSAITAGDSYSLTVLDSLTFDSSSALDYYAWNLPTSLVQGWLADPSSNKGLILLSEGEGTDALGALLFDSTYHATDHPTLVVTYTIP